MAASPPFCDLNFYCLLCFFFCSFGVFFFNLSNTATISVPSCLSPSPGAAGVTLLTATNWGCAVSLHCLVSKKVKQKLEEHEEGWGRGS